MSAGDAQQRVYCCNLCGKCPVNGVVFHCPVCRDWDCCEECRSDPDTQSEIGYTEMHSENHQLVSIVSNADPREPIASGPLSRVVANAVDRWFCDTYRGAKGGDPNLMALLSQMLETGYGCKADPQMAAFWAQLARERGARRIDGVYDRLP